MIGYVTLGTHDLERAAAFYDALLEGVGAKRAYQTDRLVAWSFGQGQPMLVVNAPFDGEPATVGNGVMVALAAPDTETIDRLHALALELGGMDEGAPGLRGHGFYGAYFRDLDGNKLNFHCFQ